jgi:hypothetical protein
MGGGISGRLKGRSAGDSSVSRGAADGCVIAGAARNRGRLAHGGSWRRRMARARESVCCRRRGPETQMVRGGGYIRTAILARSEERARLYKLV